VVVDLKKNSSPVEITFGEYGDYYAPEFVENKTVFSFPHLFPDYYKLSIGSFSTDLYLAPGDSIYLSSDFLTSENKTLKGSGTSLSNFILSDDAFSNSIYKNIDFDSIYSLPPKEFIWNIDSIYRLKTKRLEDFIEAEKVTNDVFIQTEKFRILYESSIEKNRYYRDHKFLTGEILELNDDYNTYLEQLSFNDTSLIFLESYREFLFSYFERVGLEQKDLADTGVFSEFAFKQVLDIVHDQEIRSYLLFRIMNIHLNETPINKLGNLIVSFNENCANEKYRNKINTYYLKLEKLMQGEKAPDFTLPDVNGNKVSLSDFKGNMIYIDVWNSTCSPCFKEFSSLDRLIDKYKDKNIVFIGISYDSKQEQWKRTIEKKDLKGVQLFANGWNHQFGIDYLIYSNPRFILIDSNGHFIDAKAPKPSEGIEELIIKNIK